MATIDDLYRTSIAKQYDLPFDPAVIYHINYNTDIGSAADTTGTGLSFDDPFRTMSAAHAAITGSQWESETYSDNMGIVFLIYGSGSGNQNNVYDNDFFNFAQTAGGYDFSFLGNVALLGLGTPTRRTGYDYQKPTFQLNSSLTSSWGGYLISNNNRTFVVKNLMFYLNNPQLGMESIIWKVNNGDMFVEGCHFQKAGDSASSMVDIYAEGNDYTDVSKCTMYDNRGGFVRVNGCDGTQRIYDNDINYPTGPAWAGYQTATLTGGMIHIGNATFGAYVFNNTFMDAYNVSAYGVTVYDSYASIIGPNYFSSTGADGETTEYWIPYDASGNEAVTFYYPTTGATVDVPEIVSGVFNETITKAKYDIPQSFGKSIRTQTDRYAYVGEGVTAGPNWVQLNGIASPTEGAYDPGAITVIDGLGAGQTRQIYEYWGSAGDPRGLVAGMERVCWLDRDWKVEPDATSEVIITEAGYYPHVNEGVVTSATSSTIVLNTLASQEDNAYKGQQLFIRSGSGQDQARVVAAYIGSAREATVHVPWGDIPNSASVYNIQPNMAMVAGLCPGSAAGEGAMTGAVTSALSAYGLSGVAQQEHLLNLSGGAVDVSALSGAIVSGIGAWGDLRWSKIYGIPLDEWDIIITEYSD